MAELYFKYLTDANEWSKQSTLYAEGAINIIYDSNSKNYGVNESVIKVTSIDKLTGEKHTQIMPCEILDGETLPNVETSGILMESGKLYFVEVEDLQGNVIFEHARVYSTNEGNAHSKVYGICNSSKCAVRVPSYDQFIKRIKDTDEAWHNQVRLVNDRLSDHVEFAGGMNEDLQHVTEEFEYVKNAFYGKFVTVSIFLPSMSKNVVVDYPDGLTVENAFYLGCLWVETLNGEVIGSIKKMVDVDVTCDADKITVMGLPESASGQGNRAYLKLLFVRVGL